MGIQQIPAASGGGIKLVQRGQAVSSGSIAITAVDTTKTFVRSFSEGAAGTVATNSTVAAHNSTNPAATIANASGEGSAQRGPGSQYSLGYIPARTITNASAAISGGTMDATTKQFGVHLVDSTTITATGACRWEVVEFA